MSMDDGDHCRTDARRYMFALELKAGSRTEFKWNAETAMADKLVPAGDTEGVRHTLLLRRAILGHTAKENEANLITAVVEDPDVKEAVSFPLVYLTKGKESQCKLDLTFPEVQDLGVSFNLTEGSGPIHLVGYHFVERITSDDEDYNGEAEEMDEEEDAEADPEKMAEVVEQVKAVMRAKRRMNENGNGDSAPKKPKVLGEKNGSAAAAAAEDEEMTEKELEPAQVTSTDK